MSHVSEESLSLLDLEAKAESFPRCCFDAALMADVDFGGTVVAT